ncbi:uncharacterized protein LOC126671462 [Mercurialis annua]|uniref:uncharacterized protein LOC126671462 n=1 Tax=Mercurialis annua TaxID=3986 RepID=UPI002160DDBE|nr:uncharacterized protein LOC126671462 [Mercurialis annua]
MLLTLDPLQIRPFNRYPIQFSRHEHPTNLQFFLKTPKNPIKPYPIITSASKSQPTKTQEQDSGIPIEDVKMIAKFKSRHNYIRILEISRKADHPFAGSRLLLLDSPGNIHSVFYRYKLLTNTYYDVFATLPPLLPPGPIAILGFGAGSAARIILELYPDVGIHGWELDPSVISVGRKYFGLDKLEKDHSNRLFIYIDNALDLKCNVKEKFSGIIVDLFSKGSVIPELQDPNTWVELRKCLRKDGRIMINVGGRCVEPEDKRRDGDVVMEETLKAMGSVFDDVFVLNVGCRQDDSSVALTGKLPDLDSWRKLLPKSLRFYVDLWRPFRS